MTRYLVAASNGSLHLVSAPSASRARDLVGHGSAALIGGHPAIEAASEAERRGLKVWRATFHQTPEVTPA